MVHLDRVSWNHTIDRAAGRSPLQGQCAAVLVAVDCQCAIRCLRVACSSIPAAAHAAVECQCATRPAAYTCRQTARSERRVAGASAHWRSCPTPTTSPTSPSLRSWTQTPRPLEKPLAAPNMELIYVNPEGPSGKPVIENAIKHVRSSFALRCSHSQSLVPGGRGRLPSAVPGFRWKGREQCQFLLRWPDEEGSRSQSLGQDSGDRRTDMLLQDGAIVTVYDPKGEK